MTEKALALLALLLVGCPPGLDEFHVAGDGDAGGDDAGGGSDAGSGTDAAGGDAGPPGDGGTPGPCPVPHLILAVEELDGDHGRLVRMTLDDHARCPDLTGGGSLPIQPMAVVPLGDRIVVAGREEIQVLDPSTDIVVASIPFTSVANPRGAFPIFHPTERRTLGAVALASPGGAVNRLVLVAEDGRMVEDWIVGGAAADLQYGSNIHSMTRDPRDRGRMIVLSDRWAAAEADPFAATIASDPPWVRPRTGVVLDTVAAYDDGGTHRLVWTGRDGTESHIYFFDQSLPRDDESIVGPVRCSVLGPCDWAHAVPDPTNPSRYFAICDEGASIETRRLLWVAQGGACEVLLESTGLAARPPMAFVAIRE